MHGVAAVLATNYHRYSGATTYELLATITIWYGSRCSRSSSRSSNRSSISSSHWTPDWRYDVFVNANDNANVI